MESVTPITEIKRDVKGHLASILVKDSSDVFNPLSMF